jgi:HEAT repeat protein
LKDKNKVVRETAAEVLAMTGPHGEKLLIEGLLKDSISLIRTSCAIGMRFVGPQTIRTLLLALNDKDPQVIKAAADTIEAIGVNAFVEYVLIS